MQILENHNGNKTKSQYILTTPTPDPRGLNSTEKMILPYLGHVDDSNHVAAEFHQSLYRFYSEEKLMLSSKSNLDTTAAAAPDLRHKSAHFIQWVSTQDPNH